ncbi:unnamed protein product, partial [Mesorhabditis spiculigera]
MSRRTFFPTGVGKWVPFESRVPHPQRRTSKPGTTRTGMGRSGINYVRQAPHRNMADDEEAAAKREKVQKRMRTQVDGWGGHGSGPSSQSPPVKLHRRYMCEKPRNDLDDRLEGMMCEGRSSRFPSKSHLNYGQQHSAPSCDELQTVNTRAQAIARKIIKLKESQPINWEDEVDKLEDMQVALEEERFDLMRNGLPGPSSHPTRGIKPSRANSSNTKYRREHEKHAESRSNRHRQAESDPESELSSHSEDRPRISSKNRKEPSQTTKQLPTVDQVEALKSRMAAFMKKLPPAEKVKSPLPAYRTPGTSQFSSTRSPESDPYMTPRQQFSLELGDRAPNAILPPTPARVGCKTTDFGYQGSDLFYFDPAQVARRIVTHVPYLPLVEARRGSSYIDTCTGMIDERLSNAELRMWGENLYKSASTEMHDKTSLFELDEDDECLDEADLFGSPSTPGTPGTPEAGRYGDIGSTPQVEKAFNETIRALHLDDHELGTQASSAHDDAQFDQNQDFASYDHSSPFRVAPSESDLFHLTPDHNDSQDFDNVMDNSDPAPVDLEPFDFDETMDAGDRGDDFGGMTYQKFSIYRA